MHRDARSVPEILRQLESLYRNQEPCWPSDPYDFLVWWHCGYPASDTPCAKGWGKLNSEVGVETTATPRCRRREARAGLEGGRFAHCFGSFVEEASMMFPIQIVSYVAGPDRLSDVTDRSRHWIGAFCPLNHSGAGIFRWGIA
jgi:hypothetical protein